jgi:hypothetical protein
MNRARSFGYRMPHKLHRHPPFCLMFSLKKPDIMHHSRSAGPQRQRTLSQRPNLPIYVGSALEHRSLPGHQADSTARGIHQLCGHHALRRYSSGLEGLDMQVLADLGNVIPSINASHNVR